MPECISYDGYKIYEDGTILSKVGRPLKQFTKKSIPMGYKYVSLMVRGKCKQLSVHYIVYRAFHGKVPEGMTIDHKDDNPLNNHKGNLQAMPRGANSAKGSRIVPFADLGSIRDRIAKGEKGRAIAKEYGVAEQTISNIKTGRRNKY